MSNISKQEKGTTSGEDEPYAILPPTIWEVIDEVMSDVPDEVLNRLPADGAERHDHYLRGTHAEARQES